MSVHFSEKKQQLNVNNVKQYGALGDGINTDYTAIQAAINAAASNNLPVYFPAGTYLITSPLTITNAINIHGDGSGKIFIQPSGNISALIINPSGSGYIGSVCTTSGAPGTWKTFGAISP